MSAIEWYWCLTHQRAESGEQRDDPDNSLGPYETAEAARDWRSRSESREEAWKEQDEAWYGEDGEADDDTGTGPI